MAIAFRSAATAANGAAPVSVTVAKPAGVLDDDVLIAFVTISADRAIAAAPAGWTLLDEQATGTATGDCRTAVYYKVADSEGSSYVWDFSGAADCAAVIVAYSDVSLDVPVNVSAYRLMVSSSLTHTAPAVTTSTDDTVTLTAYGVNPVFDGDTTFTTPSGLTIRAEADPGAGTTNRAALKVFDKDTGSAGSTADKATTLNNSAKGVAFTVTLAPFDPADISITVQPYRTQASATGCMIGWYESGGYGDLENVEDLLETRFALVRVYHKPDEWGTVKSTVATAIDDGRLVFASHKLPKVANAWVAFNRGDFDDDLRAIVDHYKDLSPNEIVVAFHHEPHGNSSDGSQVPTLGSPSDFKKAFRKFAKAFRDAGCTHVKICYCEIDSHADDYPNDACYPGDDYVDVFGHDVYNWGGYPGFGGWEDPDDLFGPFVADAKAANKPLIFGEIGCHPTTGGHDRGQWLRDMAAYFKTGDAATYVLGFCYYHVDSHNDSGHLWRFAEGPDADDFIAAISDDSHFLTEPISPSLRGAVAPPVVEPPAGTPPSVIGIAWGRKTTQNGVPAGYGQISGLASSPKGGAWAIGDSPDPPSSPENTLVWLTQTSRGTFAVHDVTVTGATNADWEDLLYTVESGTAYLYIHDNRDGNSSGSNPKRLYKVAEPATPAAASSVSLVSTRYWKFPVSASSSTCGSQQNCEAIFLHKGLLYAVQKTDAPEAEVYLVGDPNTLSTTNTMGGATEATLVGTIGTHCPSAFAISADGTTVVTIQHGEVEVWRGKGDTVESLLTGKNIRIYRDQPGGSGEAADWFPYQSSDFLVISEDKQTFDYDVTAGRILTSGIPSNVGFGTPTLTMEGPIAIVGAGAIPSPGDYEDPEESPGLDFGTATLTMAGAVPDPEDPDDELEGDYAFSPPVRALVPSLLPETRGPQRRLFRYYGPWPRGVSVVFIGGHYVEAPNPSSDLLTPGNEGITWFLGGHDYVVDAAIAALLIEDGFTVTPAPPAERTWASYAHLTWGELRGYTWGEL